MSGLKTTLLYSGIAIGLVPHSTCAQQEEVHGIRDRRSVNVQVSDNGSERGGVQRPVQRSTGTSQLPQGSTAGTPRSKAADFDNQRIAVIAPLVPKLVEVLPKLKKGSGYSYDRLVGHFIKIGDRDAAFKIFKLIPRPERSETQKGEIYEMLPGGLKAAAADEYPDGRFTSGMLWGAARTRARHGDFEGAIEYLKVEGVADPVRARKEYLSGFLSAKEYYELYKKDLEWVPKSGDYPAILAYAAASGNDLAALKDVLGKVSEAVAASKQPRTSPQQLRMEPSQQVEVINAAVCGLARARNLDKARSIVDAHFDSAIAAATTEQNPELFEHGARTDRVFAYRILIAANAAYGEIVAATRELERIRSEPQSGTAGVPLAYAYAKDGRLAEAEKLAAPVQAMYSRWKSADHGIGLGLIAKAQIERNNSDGAKATAERVLAMVDKCETDRERAEMIEGFISGVVNGPMAAVWIDGVRGFRID